jgi:isoleucyl-tRNA synthetase
LLAVRNEVLKGLEEARQAKKIGKALEADVLIVAGSELRDLLEKYKPGLKELFNVSRVEVDSTATEAVSPTSVDSVASSEIRTIITLASGQKCARCWNFMPEVSSYGIWQNVCTRCQSALEEMNVAPPQAGMKNEGAVA